MKLDAIRFTLQQEQAVYERGPLDPLRLPAEKRGELAQPTACIIRLDDLGPFRELPGDYKNRGDKNSRKELAAYLLRCPLIPFIVGGHTDAGQLVRSVRALLRQAAGLEDNFYIIGTDPAVFDAVLKRPQEAGLQKKKAPADHTNSPLQGLMGDHETPPALLKEFVGDSPEIALIRQMILRAGRVATPVLLLGETGSGKEVIAKSIHRFGDRAYKPFISVNCGAIPRELFESELFGHVKGAFTGATRDRDGSWKSAHTGTLFLDEIGDLSPDHQTKILRAYDTGKFRPVGDTTGKDVEVDVRLIAATNKNLFAMVQAGQFREDLYYRLRVLLIHTIPLRDHPDDIPALARHLWNKLGAGDAPLSDAIIAELKAYPWPGNVRDLACTLSGMLGFFGKTNLRLEHLRAVMLLHGQTEAQPKGPLSAWEFDLHDVQCLRHLLQASDAVHAARTALEKEVAPRKRDESALPPAVANHLEELERFCAHPLLFHREDTFEAVHRLVGKLTYFVSLLTIHRSEAIRFWKSDLKHTFEQVSSSLFDEAARLRGDNRRRKPRAS
jgi:DNA-binding NtrC family response regulator